MGNHGSAVLSSTLKTSIQASTSAPSSMSISSNDKVLKTATPSQLFHTSSLVPTASCDPDWKQHEMNRLLGPSASSMSTLPQCTLPSSATKSQYIIVGPTSSSSNNYYPYPVNKPWRNKNIYVDSTEEMARKGRLDSQYGSSEDHGTTYQGSKKGSPFSNTAHNGEFDIEIQKASSVPVLADPENQYHTVSSSRKGMSHFARAVKVTEAVDLSKIGVLESELGTGAQGPTQERSINVPPNQPVFPRDLEVIATTYVNDLSSITPGLHVLPRSNGTVHDSAGNLIAETRHRPYIAYHNAAQIGMGFVAATLLLICALLTGLTLAICGLDKTLVQLRSVSGAPRERKQANVVAQMKRHGSWMLCSLIICTCACGEYFPFVMQSIIHSKDLWLPVFVSTLCLALISEILPQYLIPRNAIAWGYYCWPIIWGCMFLTSVISWPMGWFLDHFFGKKVECGVFTNDQLESLIKYHERGEQNGGQLGQDATRIMTGALKLDGRTIGNEMTRVVDLAPECCEKDIEKAIVVVQGIVVKWSAVKTIKIDDIVNEAFIQKIKGWSYSRIPVISKADVGIWNDNQSKWEDWDGTRIYGFLHTKNLIGLDLKARTNSENVLRVKDLPLYPLPIVREAISVYELLNMFQLGMSRMAIVVASPKTDALDKPELPPLVFHDPADLSTMRWTATKRTNEKIMSKLQGNGKKLDWTSDFLAAARANATESGNEQNLYGVRTPKPIGIITYEDIIDAILQKTSRDEKDFFDRVTTSPPTKAKKIGDDVLRLSTCDLSSIGNLPPIFVPKARTSPQQSLENTLRYRTNSKKGHPVNTLDGAVEVDEMPSKYRDHHDTSGSSYTMNSRGGFHYQEGTEESVALTASDIANMRDFKARIAYSRGQASSLPSRKSCATNSGEDLKVSKYYPRHVSASPILPSIRSISPFSNDAANKKGRQSLCLKELNSSTIVNALDVSSPSAKKHYMQESGDTMITLSTWVHDYYERDQEYDAASFHDAMPVTMQKMHAHEVSTSHDLDTIEEECSKSCDNLSQKQKTYRGFPPELLNSSDENRVPNFTSLTLPKLPISKEFEDFIEGMRVQTPIKDTSFDDDRATVPSQQKSGDDGFASMRRTSFWF